MSECLQLFVRPYFAVHCRRIYSTPSRLQYDADIYTQSFFRSLVEGCGNDLNDWSTPLPFETREKMYQCSPIARVDKASILKKALSTECNIDLTVYLKASLFAYFMFMIALHNNGLFLSYFAFTISYYSW